MFHFDRSMPDPRPTISNSSLTIFFDHWPGNSIVPFKWFDYPWGICLPMVGFTPAKRIPIERHDYVNTSNNVGTILQNCSSSVSIPTPFVIIGEGCVDRTWYQTFLGRSTFSYFKSFKALNYNRIGDSFISNVDVKSRAFQTVISKTIWILKLIDLDLNAPRRKWA